MSTAGRRSLISAHRCNDRERLVRALDLGVDRIEFDLQQEDGAVVVAHDPGARELISYAEVLDLIAGRAGIHLDLKFATSDHRLEIEAVAAAVAAVGAAQVVVTGGRPAMLAAVRRWADAEGLDLRIGLSVGRGLGGLGWRRRWQILREDLSPWERLAEAGCDVLVPHWSLALIALARGGRRRGVPVLVWTVDAPRALRFWLRPGRIWMVTTNRPEEALAARVGSGGHGSAARLRS